VTNYQGENMRDTVELLEAIGRDARLRHASPEELAKALEEANASAGLRDLVASGDSKALTEELGIVQMHVEHQSQTSGHEGDDDDRRHHPDQDDKDDKDDKSTDDSDDTSPT
jgi:hypothetical protein